MMDSLSNDRFHDFILRRSTVVNIDQRLLTVWQTVGLCYQYSFLLPHLTITLGTTYVHVPL